ncbi:transcriptional regulator ATRX [Lingula anatina]|uniref:Transcriptional regulator ATRX n=1 Tax=Lingula anatina TaxID=7574 RepID=A0A1S3JD58_LINAN|nr:transcriptional regulator ATRX [Lingula anatina]|eukprot:XP_013408258.1 transcriptional regulator ATRX [Lingula anatina]
MSNTVNNQCRDSNLLFVTALVIRQAPKMEMSGTTCRHWHTHAGAVIQKTEMPSQLRSRKIPGRADVGASTSKVVAKKIKKPERSSKKKEKKAHKPVAGKLSKKPKASNGNKNKNNDPGSFGGKEKIRQQVSLKDKLSKDNDDNDGIKRRTARQCKVEAQTNIKLLSSPGGLFKESKVITDSPKLTLSRTQKVSGNDPGKTNCVNSKTPVKKILSSCKDGDKTTFLQTDKGSEQAKAKTLSKASNETPKSRLTRSSVKEKEIVKPKGKSLYEELLELEKGTVRKLRQRVPPVKRHHSASRSSDEDEANGLINKAIGLSARRPKIARKDIASKPKSSHTSQLKTITSKTKFKQSFQESNSEDSSEEESDVDAIENDDGDRHLEDSSGDSSEEEDISVIKTLSVEEVEKERKAEEEQKKKEEQVDEVKRLKNVLIWKQEQLVDLRQVQRQNTVLEKKIAQLTKSNSSQVIDNNPEVVLRPLTLPECSDDPLESQITKFKDSIKQIESEMTALESAVEVNMELESRLRELQHSKEREQYYEKEEERKKKNEEVQKQTEKALLQLQQENEKLQEMVKKAREDQWKNEQDRMKNETTTLNTVNGMLEGMLKNLMKGIGTQVASQNTAFPGTSMTASGSGAPQQPPGPGFSSGSAFFPGYGWIGSNSLPPGQALAQMADMLAAHTLANAKGQTINQTRLPGQPPSSAARFHISAPTSSAKPATLVSVAESVSSSTSSTLSQSQKAQQPAIVDLTQSPVLSSVPLTNNVASQQLSALSASQAPIPNVDRSRLYFTTTGSLCNTSKLNELASKTADSKGKGEMKTKGSEDSSLTKVDGIKSCNIPKTSVSNKNQDAIKDPVKEKMEKDEAEKTSGNDISKDSDIEILDTSAESSSSEKGNKKSNKGKKGSVSKEKQKGKKKMEIKGSKGKQKKEASSTTKRSLRGSKTHEKKVESDNESEIDTRDDGDIIVVSSEEEEEKKIANGKRKKRSPMRTTKRRTRSRKDESEESESGAEADDDEADDDEESVEGGKKGKKKKNKKEDGTPGQYKRRDIQRLFKRSKLKKETLEAEKAEKERLKRVEEIKKKHHVVQVPDPKSPNKCPVTTKLVLEMDANGKPVIEVNSKLAKKLKPHQVEAVEFQWDCCIETLDTLKKEEGSGCILAHCMGLGKTLSAITLVHTLLSNKVTGLKTCLVVCPLNTVLNWKHELNYWLDKKDRLKVYEIVSVKVNKERSELLKKWHNGGGVMIIGYQMFRILSHSHTKSKVQKEIFTTTLLDPGPDIVICDEGHMLKNDSSAISKAMNKIRTLRRVILTGTPLQNNLSEYHCMVNFVKPNLLGTRKEFSNRFINPITNGQCSDSTPLDVKLMKKRSHVLHEMLSGCVQRRDYSALTKYLPEKYEYILSVRLSPIQMTLYQEYLKRTGRSEAVPKNFFTGASLFQDYHHLHRIWTHPWVLRLEQIRQENRMVDDGASSFAESSEDEESEEEILEEVESTTSPSDISSESAMSLSESESEVSKEGSQKNKKSQGKVSKGSREKNRKEALLKGKGRTEKDVSKEDTKLSKGTRSSSVLSENKKSSKQVPKKKDEDKEIKFRDLDDELRTRIHGEYVRGWKSLRRGGKEFIEEAPKEREKEWWEEYIREEDQHDPALSGKLMLLFDIIRMAEAVGDKVLVFSQSLLSLDLIEQFLARINEQAKAGTNLKKSKKKLNPLYNTWTKNEDYFRIDGSTVAQHRQKYMGDFQDHKNTKGRLFLISTKAGSLGINLEAANRVVIFDASWNPSHDIQSIFRVYRFGQEKPVFVYRFLAQGTMEEKIYQRQVSKQSLAQRVVDEQQIERHFSAADLAELYSFKPERLDDPERKKKPTPKLPKDKILAELLSTRQDWLVGYHEHDSLLQNIEEETLTEEERKTAWEEYENEKQGIFTHLGPAFAPPPPPMQFKFMYPRPQSQPYRNLAPRPAHPPSLGGRPPSLASFPNLNQQLTLGINQHLPPGVPLTPQFHQQLQRQLPNVIQAILKTNPGVSIDELQRRLQQFLKTQLMYHFQAILKQQGFPYKKLPTGAEQAQAQQVQAQQQQAQAQTHQAQAGSTPPATLPFMPSLLPNPVVNLTQTTEERGSTSLSTSIPSATGSGQSMVVKAQVHANGTGDQP